ncbi:MAG: hypothetical protein ACD_50C00231G0003 [uncultured bacterium]|nr:MAG: hypothetical protein ACD_50C00231G0003 [uncultured bacterium]OGH14651.1 MAG: hypothetical protein A2687_00540 [Candidatus Levybacteria bacterium RIFCSPHIGHO2_01_FULL_38_26]
MKNSLVIIAGVAVLGVVGVSVFVLSQNPASSPNSAVDQTMMDDENMMGGDETMTHSDSDSRYVEYSKSALDSSSGKRRVLFFYANWCPTCRPADISFRENESRIPEDVVLIRVNYNDSDTDNEEKDLAQKYGVTYQHTYVQVDSLGNEVFKWNGGQIDELLNNIR